MEGHENCTCDPATHHHAQDSNGLVKLTLLDDLCIYHLALCVDHLASASFEQRDGYSNVLGQPLISLRF